MSQPEHSHDAPMTPLTLRKRLWAFTIVARLPFATAIGVFRENKGRSWALAANIAATRYLFDPKWGIDVLRYFTGATTSQVYQEWARGNEQDQPEVLTDLLSEGAKLHWIGPRRDAAQDRVFLYFHGGAFVVPAQTNYFLLLRALQKDLSASFGDVGMAVLEYSLAPESPLPTQLRQANAALSHLLNKGISPANIVIGGDSAGGNLVLQLMSHILHPLPSIPPPPALSQALAGAMLISPWCEFSADDASFTRNDRKDIITARSSARFSAIIKAGLTPELEYYCQPLSAPASWWNGLDGVYSRVLITAGEHECLLDQIIETGTVISHNVKDTVLMVEPGAVHEEMIFKFGTGEGGSGKEYDAMVGFLSRAFRGGSSMTD